MSKTEDYLQRSLQNVIPHLEARRRHYQRHVLFGLIVAPTVGVACLALALIGGLQGQTALLPAGLVAALLLPPFFVLIAIGARDRYKAFFAREVTPLLAVGLYQSFRADPKKDLDSLRKDIGGGFGKRLGPVDGSFFEGRCRDVAFSSFAYVCRMKTKKNHQEPIGRVYEFFLNVKPGVDLLIKNKETPFIDASKSLPMVVKTENLLFEEGHATSSNDEAKAREILTPSVLAAVLAMESDCQGNLSGSIQGSHFSLLLEEKGPSFALSVFHPITLEFLHSYGAEIALGGRLIKAFGLR